MADLSGMSDEKLLRIVEGQDASVTNFLGALALTTFARALITIILLLIRVVMIQSRPSAEWGAARRKLGVWPRLMTVLTISWSMLLSFVVLASHVRNALANGSQPLLLLTCGPVLFLWTIYFAERWVRLGATTK